MSNKYLFSFTGASALIAETLVVAEEFEKKKDWVAVEKSILDNNLLLKIKNATSKRELQEIKKRLRVLSEDQIRVLIEGDIFEVKAIILLALVKTYKYIYDFITESLLTKYMSFDYVLTTVDYDRFFNAKSLSHPELEILSESTLKKIKQRVFTLLEQTGLISKIKNGSISKPILSERVIDVILLDEPSFLKIFLYTKEEIELWQKRMNYV